MNLMIVHIFEKLSGCKPSLLLDLISYYEALAKGGKNVIISLMIRMEEIKKDQYETEKK